MNAGLTISSVIREDVLSDPRYPVHRIADQLRPFLKVLVERFRPVQVILFGSYAYGEPGPDSDIDLLVVKPIMETAVADATEIRRVIRPLRRTVANFPFDIMVRSPDDFAGRVRRGAALHSQIARDGLVLVG
jgi:predicted nucleotidyltransferase